MENFLIIADDFTGANDTGVQIRKRGIQTRVLLDASGIRDDGTSVVLDTESRNIAGKSAYELVWNQIRNIPWDNWQNIIKKVDSTLRGNIAWELKAMDESYKPDCIVFAPAFPEIGRTTIGGIHRLEGKPITQTEIARDPKKPVTEDRICGILREVYSEAVEEWDLRRLRSGQVIGTEARLHCFDAETPSDMRLIVETVLAWKKRVLWTGSAGIANTLLSVQFPAKPVLGVVGSVSEKSREQLMYCEAKGKTIIKLDIAALITTNNIARYVKKCLELIQEGKDLILSSAYSRDDYEQAVKTGEANGMSAEAVSDFTRRTLAKLVSAIAQEAGKSLGGFFLTGGDTAIGLIHETGAFGSTIDTEVVLGVPMMHIDGGSLAGRTIITKAGAFGVQDTIYYGLEKLKEQN
jgi:uncharacterized protein YgbK (DUF1537 family)